MERTWIGEHGHENMDRTYIKWHGKDIHKRIWTGEYG